MIEDAGTSLEATCGFAGGFLWRGGLFTGSGGSAICGTGCAGIVTSGGGRLAGSGLGEEATSSIGGASG